MKVFTRWATDEDAPRLAEFAKGTFFEEMGADWSRIEPYWLVAESEGVVEAGIQILTGLPVSRMDYLLVRPDLPIKLRAVCVRQLTSMAEQVLKMTGSKLVGSCIDEDVGGDYLRIAERHGWRLMARAFTVFRSLA